MRKFRSFLIVLLFWPMPASAEPSHADIEAIAAHTQRLQETYQQGLSISFGMDEAEAFIESFYDGEISEADLRAGLDPFLVDVDNAIAGYRNAVAAGLQPPPIDDPKRARAMRSFSDMVVSLADRLDRQRAVVDTLLRAATSGDDAAYQVASADSLALAVEMVLAENVALETSQLALSPTHPQFGLNLSIIGGNEAVAIALRIIEADLRNEQFDAAAYARGVAGGLRRAEQGIDDGEAAIEKLIGSVRGKPVRTEQDRYSHEFIGRLGDAYRMAFVIERRILDAERDFLEFLRLVSGGGSGLSGDEMATRAAAFQVALEEHTAARMEQQAFRLQLVQEFASTMQTLSN